MKRHPAIIAYDVVCNRRRRQVKRCLQAWRLDGQHSVCECRLSQPEAEELFMQLGERIDPKTDRLLLAWLDVPEQAHVLVGRGQIGFRQAGCYLG